ncbi:MAG: biotin/lipoyl-containing protein [Candidatus Eisenbacteria bacterium]
MEYEFSVAGEKHSVRLEGKPPNARVVIGEREYEVDWTQVPGGAVSMIVDGESRTARIARREGGLVVWVDGRRVDLDMGSAADEAVGSAGAGGGGSGIIKAPMPGSVVKVLVSEGQEVTAGQSLVIVEAMKMENEVRSPVAGVVKAVNVSEGDSVGTTEPMIEVEPAETDE